MKDKLRTQTQVAAHYGVSAQAVGHWKKNYADCPLRKKPPWRVEEIERWHRATIGGGEPTEVVLDEADSIDKMSETHAKRQVMRERAMYIKWQRESAQGKWIETKHHLAAIGALSTIFGKGLDRMARNILNDAVLDCLQSADRPRVEKAIQDCCDNIRGDILEEMKRHNGKQSD